MKAKHPSHSGRCTSETKFSVKILKQKSLAFESKLEERASISAERSCTGGEHCQQNSRSLHFDSWVAQQNLKGLYVDAQDCRLIF